MRKGRIIKGLAMAIIAVMVLGCLSLNNTSAATNHSNHIDIRTNAAITLSGDGSLDGVTISKDNISYVGYKVGNATNFTEGIWQKLTDGREKYEVKYNVSPTFDVFDETLQILIKGTYSNGDTIGKDGEGVIIDQTTTYPDKTYIEYNNTNGNNTIYAMKYFGIEKTTINGKEYYDVSNKKIISVAIAMCNGAKATKDGKTLTVCGTDFYLNPDIIKIIEDQDELTVKKNWTNVEGSLIPSNVTVQLYKDGEAVEGKTAVLSADNDWTAVIKYTKEEGYEDKYTVKEIKIGDKNVGDTDFTYTAEENVSYGAITFEDELVALDEISLEQYYDYKTGEYKYSWFYYVDALDNAFGVAKMKDKDQFVIWTYKALPDADKEVFINAINAKGTISGLTIDNTIFKSGLDADAYTYDKETPGTPDSYDYATKKAKKDKFFTSYSAAETAMNAKIEELKNEYKDVDIVSSKVVANKTKYKSTLTNKYSYNYNEWFYNETTATMAMNEYLQMYKDAYANDQKYVVDTSYSSVNKWGGDWYYHAKADLYEIKEYSYEIEYTYTKVEKNRTLAFDYKENYDYTDRDGNKKHGNIVLFQFSNREDWQYLYDGRFTSESTPDKTTITIYNTIKNDTTITGSKTFDMQNQNDITSYKKTDGTPNINLEVYQNGVAVAASNYDVEWKQVDNSNTWNFTIKGDAITKYYDSNNDDDHKLDAVAEYTVREKDAEGNVIEDGGVINIDNFDYDVAYGDNNAITNTLDTSGFTGDLTINKTIDDVNPVNGKAIFTYKVEGEGKTYYAVIVVDSETKTGTTTLKGLKIGNYTVTELNTMRFAKTSVTPDGGAASVTRNGEAKVDFTNALKVRTNFSHTDVTVNSFTKTADGIDTNKEDDDNVKTVVTYTKLVTPAYR